MNFIALLSRLNCYIRLYHNPEIEENDDKLVLVFNNGSRINLNDRLRLLKPIIIQISITATSISSIIDNIAEVNSFEMLPLFYSLVDFLDKKGLIIYCIPDVLEVRPLSAYTLKNNLEDELDFQYKLSRFTFIRYDNEKILMETVLNAVEAEIHDMNLFKFIFSSDSINLNNSIDSDIQDICKIKDALKVLYIFSFITDGIEEDDYLKQWEFHDLLLHAHSRCGRNVGGYGSTYRFKGNVECLPAVIIDQKDESKVILDKPDIELLKKTGKNFFDVNEKRCSSRSFNKVPITLNEVGSFLYLTSRVKSFEMDTFYEITKRPYPNGGSLYELELYIIVLNCKNLKNGLYHYDPVNHLLYNISPITNPVQKMVYYAQEASRCKDIQVLITISARFQRVFWKYEAIGYSLILKNTGVLLQNMSLVATAMNIGSCILGSGDSDALSEVLGKKFYEESAVGEIIIGSQ